MTRKDFELIADVIKGMEDPKARESAAQAFADRLRLVNPRFNRARFMEACNVEATS